MFGWITFHEYEVSPLGIAQVRDAVSVPVIAAGGIADARGIVAALALGASGVQLGTAYLRSGSLMRHGRATTP
jgi:NAD(P)H-dependent flavin oxidoreductase YrpB (nitropropane dioxygenase family)